MSAPAVEWGVRCKHGVAVMPNEAAAIARGSAHGCAGSEVVSREVTGWTAAGASLRATRDSATTGAGEVCVVCGEDADEGPVASNGDYWCGECYREGEPS